MEESNKKTEAFMRLYQFNMLPQDVMTIVKKYEENGTLDQVKDILAESYSQGLQKEGRPYRPKRLKESISEFQDEISSLEGLEPQQWEKQDDMFDFEKGEAVINQEKKIKRSLQDKIKELKSRKKPMHMLTQSDLTTTEDTKYQELIDKINSIPVVEAEEPNFIDIPQRMPTWEEHRKAREAEVGRGLGIGTRKIAEGVAGFGGMVYDPASYLMAPIINLFVKEKRRPQVLKQRVSNVLTELGVPNPENESERLLGQFVEFSSGAIGEVSFYKAITSLLGKATRPVTQKVLEKLTEQPGTQMIASGVSGAASEEAKQRGMSPGAQIATSLISGTAAGMGTSAVLRPPQMIPKDLPELTSVTRQKAAAAGAIEDIDKQATREMLEVAKEYDIPIYKSNIQKPEKPFGKYIQRMKESLPLGTGSKLVEQEHRKVNAIKNFLTEHNASRADSLLEPIYNNLKDNHKLLLTKLVKKKNSIINSIDTQAVVQYPNTLKKIRKLIWHNKRLGQTEELVKLLKGYRESLRKGTFNLRLFDEKRSQLGTLFQKSELGEVRDLANKAKSELYKEMRKDMAIHIRKYAGRKKVQEWNDTFKELADMIEKTEKTSLKNILNKGEVTPETVDLIVYSNYPSLAKILYRKLDNDGRKLVKSALLRKAYKSAIDGNEFSPTRFRQAIEETSNTLNIFMNKKDIKKYEGLNRVIQATERSEEIKKGRGGLYPFLGVGIIGTTAAELTTGYGKQTAAIFATPMILGLLSNITENTTISKLLLKIPDFAAGSPEESAAIKRVIDLIQIEADKMKEFERVEPEKETRKVINQ